MTTDYPRVPTVADRELELEVAAVVGDLSSGDWVAVEWAELYTLALSALQSTALPSGEVRPHHALTRLGVLLAGSGSVHKIRATR